MLRKVAGNVKDNPPNENLNFKTRWDMYAAAKTGRLTGPWNPSDADVNRIIALSSPAVRSRIRQLVRDFPYFSRAVRIMCDYTVGPGIIFQSKIRDVSTNKLDRRRNQAVEDAFSFWADEADVAGKLHFYEMEALAKRQDMECGEFIMIKRFRPNDGRYLPYALQLYEADWLTSQNDTALGPLSGPGKKTNEPSVDIYQGVEYERATGRVLAYHFTDPDGWGKPVRVPAEKVIHGFETLRPGQLRGISPFTPGVMVAHDLSGYMDSEFDAAKMASRYLGSIETDNPMGMAAGWTTETDPETGEARAVEEMENAILKILNPGEKMNISANPRPSDNFPPMVRLILCMLSVTTGAPYELVSGDYQQVSWSTAKIIRTDFSQTLRPITERHIRHFCRPAVRPFFDYAVAYGKVSLPNYFNNPARWIRVQWQPPGMESSDLLRDTKATIDQIGAGLRAPQEHVGARGRDLEEIYEQIKSAQDLAKEIGLSLSVPSTALKNNPAAVEEQ
jgi:lambda family phage portal protein